ncbi:MAG: hypothetical protein ABIG93_00920 [archaeon]|nr:hypothetical protein [Nanoarchaeota archaeon]
MDLKQFRKDKKEHGFYKATLTHLGADIARIVDKYNLQDEPRMPIRRVFCEEGKGALIECGMVPISVALQVGEIDRDGYISRLRASSPKMQELVAYISAGMR